MSTAVWIVIALVVFVSCVCSGGRKQKGNGSEKPFRIDHPHYMSDDESECSVCGCRFSGKKIVCPKCGTRFCSAQEDDGEFGEELELWDGDDD